ATAPASLPSGGWLPASGVRMLLLRGELSQLLPELSVARLRRQLAASRLQPARSERLNDRPRPELAVWHPPPSWLVLRQRAQLQPWHRLLLFPAPLASGVSRPRCAPALFSSE